MARWARIVVLSVLVRATAWLHLPKDYRSTHEYATAARLCTETITDSIASVPYQLGYVSKSQRLSKSGRGGTKSGDIAVQKRMSAVLLAWSLNGLQSQDHVTEAQRVWIKGRLNVIGTQLGIGYGTFLAKVRCPIVGLYTYLEGWANLTPQLNIRVPSMLIRRDHLLSKLHSLNAVRLCSDGTHTSADGDQTAMQKRALESRIAELLVTAMGKRPEVDEWTVRTLLQLPQDIGRT
jgi:hypothetical protein